MLKSSLTILTTILLSATVFAQSFSINPAESEVTIYGTSNIHDWESQAEEFSGTASINMQDGELLSIDELKFDVLVDGIKSGKGGMDSKTYDALNKKKYPNIIFKLDSLNKIEEGSLEATGTLTISGVTKTIQMNVSYELLPDNAVSFTGTKNLKMTDYNVDPPTAVFGTIKAGDEVEVKFDVRFVSENIN